MQPGLSVEGAFASRNPRAVTLAGSSAFRAGLAGVLVGRFGWADPITGYVDNARTSGAQVRGFILTPYRGPPNRWAGLIVNGVRLGPLSIPAGYQLTMCSEGDLWARFPGGAVAGQPVYANPVDGTVISGNTGGAELTPWNVITSTPPGQLAIISTVNKVQ